MHNTIEQPVETTNDALTNLAGFFDVLIQMDLAQPDSIYQKLRKQEGTSDESN